MRNFTLCASALLLTAGAVASPLKPVTNHNRFGKTLGDEKMQVDLRKSNAFHSMDKSQISLAECVKKNGKKVKAAAATRAESENFSTDIIDQQPAGSKTDWTKSCAGYYSFWGIIGCEEMSGVVQQIVEGEDGKLYLNVLFSQFPLGDIWVAADKNADGGFSISAGQCVYAEEYEGEMGYFYLTPMALGDYNDEIDDFDYIYYDSVDFNYVDGSYVQADPEVILGLCEIDETTDWEYWWSGYGDANIVLAPLTSEMASIPDNLISSVERWAALTDGSGYFVDVIVDGNKMYTKGLIYGIEDGVMVGDIEGDKVTFKAGQFVGMDYYWTWTYVYGGKVETVWNEEWEWDDIVATITGDLVFKYDAENKRMITENAIIVAGSYSDNLEEVVPVGYIEELTVELQHRNPDAVPQNPYDVAFYDEMEYYGSNTLDFKIPELDVDGNLLDSANLYYRLYVDGDLFTFYGDEYIDVPEEGVDMLNCNFTNFEDIWVSGISKSIYLYFEGVDEIGIQSVYLQPVEGGEPKELVSEIVSIETNAIKNVETSETISSKWYDLQGREVKNPAAGIYLRVDAKADGSKRGVKVVK